MDVITINNDGTFDSGNQPIDTSTNWLEIGRLTVRGRKALVSIIIGSQTIASLRVLQSAYPDDPNPVVLASGSGLNSPALSDQSYIIPAVTFPLAANSVFQLHFQGDAQELIFQAQTAGGANGTVRVAGSVIDRKKFS